MSFMWSKENTKTLISLVEGMPELWDLSNPCYKNKAKKQAALERLAEEFKTTSAEVSRKIHNLRTQVNNEIRKMRKKNKGLTGEEVCNSTWEFFEAMAFMISTKSNKMRRSSDNESPATSDSESSQASVDASQNTKKRKIKAEDKILEMALEVLNTSDDDHTVFGQFVASSLRNLKTEKCRKKMRRQIQRLILDIEEEDDLMESLSVLQD